MIKDCYQILGVEPAATAADIKAAHRRLAKRFHPDRNRGQEAEGRFKEIQESYEILSDPRRRAKLDDQLGRRRSPRPDRPPEWPTAGDKAAEEPPVERIRQARGADRSDVVFVPASAAPQIHIVDTERVDPCPCCTEGSEQVTWVYCDRCGGSGRVVIRHQFKVRIPGGIQHGGVVKLRGLGDIGLNGGPRGDIRLSVRHIDKATWQNVRRKSPHDHPNARPISEDEALDELAALMTDLDPSFTTFDHTPQYAWKGDQRSNFRRLISGLTSYFVRLMGN